MKVLKEKTEVDDEAMEQIKRIRRGVQTINRLFLKNRHNGSTEVVKSAIAYADSPLLLTGNIDMGNKIAISDKVKHKDVKIVSWTSAESQSTRGVEGKQIVVDNSFMLRAMDSIVTALTFLIAEVKTLKREKKALEEDNNSLKEKLNDK